MSDKLLAEERKKKNNNKKRSKHNVSQTLFGGHNKNLVTVQRPNFSEKTDAGNSAISEFQ